MCGHSFDDSQVMKKSLFALLIFAYSACSHSSSQLEKVVTFTIKVSEAFSIDPDTVLLDVSRSLRMASLGAEGRFLYAFDPKRNQIDVFDLVARVYKESVVLDKEGPNGTGQRVIGFSYLNREKVHVRALNALHTFSSSADRLETIRLEDMQHQKAAAATGLFFINNPGTPDAGLENFYWLYDSLNNGKKGIASLDLRSKELRFSPIQGLDVFQQYDFKPLSFPPEISHMNEQVVLSHSCLNDLLIFNVNDSSATVMDYESQLIANEKKMNRPQGSGSASLNNYMADLRSQVSFMPPVFDSTQKLHYRLAIEQQKVVVQIFDANLNFLYESAIELSATPVHYFAHHGTLILVSNVSDSLQVQCIQITMG